MTECCLNFPHYREYIIIAKTLGKNGDKMKTKLLLIGSMGIFISMKSICQSDNKKMQKKIEENLGSLLKEKEPQLLSHLENLTSGVSIKSYEQMRELLLQAMGNYQEFCLSSPGMSSDMIFSNYCLKFDQAESARIH